VEDEHHALLWRQCVEDPVDQPGAVFAFERAVGRLVIRQIFPGRRIALGPALRFAHLLERHVDAHPVKPGGYLRLPLELRDASEHLDEDVLNNVIEIGIRAEHFVHGADDLVAVFAIKLGLGGPLAILASDHQLLGRRCLLCQLLPCLFVAGLVGIMTDGGGRAEGQDTICTSRPRAPVRLLRHAGTARSVAAGSQELWFLRGHISSRVLTSSVVAFSSVVMFGGPAGAISVEIRVGIGANRKPAGLEGAPEQPKWLQQERHRLNYRQAPCNRSYC
jgi:hypothetical protein